ncbi:MAG: transcriptional regulator [Saprospiraceae bacterium]|nr:MAG: transcriptional regulator [Saprospiraceae bacterium]
MTQLTKAEEEVMQIIWRLGPCLVSQIVDELERERGERPPHSTISSIVRILESKGYVSHKAYGRTYEYYPVVSKDDYARNTLKRVLSGYFDGSAKRLVSFLIKEEKIDPDELSDLLKKLDE